MREPREDALVLRIARLVERLDQLRVGQLPKASALEWIWDRLDADGTVGGLDELTALTGVLERIGLHSAAEARLLRRLSPTLERLTSPAQGIERRCERACTELERAVRRATHLLRIGEAPAGTVRLLEARLRELQRVVRIANALGETGEAPGADEEGDPSTPGAAAASSEARPSALQRAWEGRVMPPGSAQLELARLFAARANDAIFDAPRRKRELDLAHAVLLGADAGDDRQEVMELRWQLAQARAEPPGGSGAQGEAPELETLLHEVRRTSVEDPPAAWRALHQLHARAVQAGRPALAQAGLEAMEALAPASQLRAHLDRRLEEASAAGRRSQEDARLGALLMDVSPQRARLLELARGCSRYFDVGEGLGEEVEVEAAAPVAALPRQVSWSSQRLDFETTGSVERAHDFVIDDPRRILHDLASHKQVVRTWLEEAPRQGPRPTRRSSVRVYVCDASGSMHGARARFRDAILIAELDAMLKRAARGEPLDPLYYGYFDDRLRALLRVEDEDDVLRHLEKLLHATPAAGPTDITLALTSAFDTIVQARSRDPHLGRATVVLVTDGEDRIDVELLESARKPLQGLPVALSLISLGQENPDLRRLAHGQRELGGRAFYAHLDDAELVWARSAFETPFKTLLPDELPEAAAANGSAKPMAIDREALERRLLALERVARSEDARVQGLKPLPVASGSFERLFPAEPPSLPSTGDDFEHDVGRALSFLEAIEAVVPLVPLLDREGECLRLLEHLCGVHALQPADWLAALGTAGERAREPLRRLRFLVHPLGR